MRILLIEDDPRIRSFVARGLEEEAHVVVPTGDGEEGLHLALQADYDLAIIDLMLPVVSGEEILASVRAAGIDVPVLVLTAKDAVRDKVQVLDAGADDYLAKPFSILELSARLRALFRRTRGSVQNTLRLAELTVDPLTRRVTLGGETIELTAKEYSLLYFLAQHAGHVLTRSAIAENVWGEHFESFSNVIDVHVNRLRRKLHRPGQPQLVHTVRGVGYVLRV